MGCPPPTPSRPWWLDSPLTAAAQSPLAAVSSTLSGGNVTPLGPPTPLGIGAGEHLQLIPHFYAYVSDIFLVIHSLRMTYISCSG